MRSLLSCSIHSSLDLDLLRCYFFKPIQNFKGSLNSTGYLRLSDSYRLDLKQIITSTYINMVILSWNHILLTFSEKNAVTVRKRNTHRNVSTVLFCARVRNTDVNNSHAFCVLRNRKTTYSLAVTYAVLYARTWPRTHNYYLRPLYVTGENNFTFTRIT